MRSGIKPQLFSTENEEIVLRNLKRFMYFLKILKDVRANQV